MLTSPAQGRAAPAVLNHEYLAGLQTYLGAAHARELLSDGMIDLAGRLDRLAELAARGDNGRIATLSHEIVGVAGHLGLGLMSHLAAQASQAARNGDAAAWVDTLLEVRAASIGALRDYCASHAAGDAA
jgi:HPt (histidine-containing phosphotransfer) domain-containing protein